MLQSEKIDRIVRDCHSLLTAYHAGRLGPTRMPEESNPGCFESQELRLAYFTLPMSLNYQRDSYKLWEAALHTFNDPSTQSVFDVRRTADGSPAELRALLTRHRLALQPNRHTDTWHRICKTVAANWGSFDRLIASTGQDYLRLQKTVQGEFKRGLPYLSGPKIFNYWCFILGEYGGRPLKNAESIEIAPDTHVTQCSVRLGVITEGEAATLCREEISSRWREVLAGSGIAPIQMHPALWFWSRNGFAFEPAER